MTKVHAVVTKKSIPLAIRISPANSQEASEFFDLIEGIRLRRKGRGRAKTRPFEVAADGIYDNEGIRGYLRERDKGEIYQGMREAE